MYRTPERGMSTYSSTPPKAWLTAAIPAQRSETGLPAAFLSQRRGDSEEDHKRRVITLFDLAFADQSKQDGAADSRRAQLLAFV